MTVKVQKLKPEAIVPSYAYPGDAGLSMHALEDAILAPGERHVFHVGWALEFDRGYVALVLDRGSVGAVHGLKTLGGVFDSNYRGEYNVCLVNLSREAYEIKKGDKIAQLVIFPRAEATIKETAKLTKTARGAKRFGSSGR